MLVGEPGLDGDGRLFVMRHCREVDRRAFGGHKGGTGSSAKRMGQEEKKGKGQSTRCKRTESEAQERDGRREEDCKRPRRGRAVGWRRRCRVACGLERDEERKERKKNVWAPLLLFFLFVLPINFFFPQPRYGTAPPPPRQGFRPRRAREQPAHATADALPRGGHSLDGTLAVASPEPGTSPKVLGMAQLVPANRHHITAEALKPQQAVMPIRYRHSRSNHLGRVLQ